MCTCIRNKFGNRITIATVLLHAIQVNGHYTSVHGIFTSIFEIEGSNEIGRKYRKVILLYIVITFASFHVSGKTRLYIFIDQYTYRCTKFGVN